MESKKKKDSNIKGKTPKNKIIKKYSLCFPFHINIKIISEQKKILEISDKIQNLFSKKISLFLFGLSTSLNSIQKSNKEEKLLFIFYNEKMETLYDLILFRAKFNANISIYFINEEWKKKFLDIFKLKKLLSFILIKNNLNDSIFNEIKTILESYNINNDINKIISENRIQETTIKIKK